ncbi:hypothetical protein [Baekduia sp. Peel2402]|uniref:hypothetical protein n=1 Tax=Baekduia sp. Peel2402 TaxID=3458296 RepID=UPI00403EEFF9
MRASVERRPRVWSDTADAVARAVVPVIVVALLLGPMAFDRGILGIDWFAHAWYIDHQGQALRHGILPSLYAHNAASVFDPHFAYYAGNMYALGGLLALLTGSATTALVLLFALAFACGYGGLSWLARQAGAGPWAAHAPAVLLVSSAYYVATVYGGGWLEVTAVSALPLLVASAWALVSAGEWRTGPALALAGATILFTGSHNLSLAWGTTMLLVVGAAVLLLAPDVRRAFTRDAILRLASVMVPATLVNAWFLLPVMAYSSNTVIGSDRAVADQSLRDTMFMVQPGRLLTLSRGTVDDTVPYYVCALPLLAIAWVLVSLVLARARHRSPWFRVALALLALIAVLSVVAGSLSLLLALPSPWGLLQLGYRLEAYIQLALGGAIIAGLVLTTGNRRWAWALLPIVLISLAQGRQQATPSINPDVGPSYQRASIPYISPKPVQGSADYAEADVPLAQDPGGAPIRFDPRDPTAPVAVGPGSGGTERASNLVAAPTLIDLDGATIVGRSPDGTAVLRVDDGATQVSAAARHPWPVTAGAVLSLLGLVALGGVLVLRPGARGPTSRPPRDARGLRRPPR